MAELEEFSRECTFFVPPVVAGTGIAPSMATGGIIQRVIDPPSRIRVPLDTLALTVDRGGPPLRWHTLHPRNPVPPHFRAHQSFFGTLNWSQARIDLCLCCAIRIPRGLYLSLPSILTPPVVVLREVYPVYKL